MQTSLRLPFFLLFLISGLFFLQSCTTASECEACEGCEEKCAAIAEEMYEYEDLGTHKLISAYHNAMLGNDQFATSDDSTDVYVDISNGMKQPMSRDPQIKGLFSDLRNLLLDDDSQYFTVFGDKINSLGSMSSAQLDAYFYDASNYNQAYAPLEKVVNRIAERNDRESVFITDGELWTSAQPYPSSNHSYAWGAAAFRKWLEEDNEIDIVVRTFKPAGRSGIKEMRFFMLFFTPRDKAISGESLIEDFMEKVENGGKANLITRLNFSRNAYKLEQINPHNLPQNEAGLNSMIPATWEYNLKRDMVGQFQHLHYVGDPGDHVDFMNNFVDGVFDEDMDRATERKKLFYDLEITNHFVNYAILEVEARTYGIDQSLANMHKHLRCMKSDTVVITDEETLQKTTVWCNPAYDCQPTSVCEFQPADQPVNEMFSIHEAFFDNWEPEDARKGNIAIRPHPTFNPDNLYNYNQFKVEVYIKKARYKAQPDFNLLSWQDNSFSNSQVNGLQESIRQAMEALEPENKVIYTYYISVGDLILDEEF